MVRYARDRTESASILRRLFGDRGSIAPVGVAEAVTVAIASGKGGTGKSFVASNLAVGIARRGVRTTLVDCDFGLGNAHLLLGLNPRVTLQHVVGQHAAIDEVRHTTSFGPGLVPAGSGISRMADLSEKELFSLVQGLSRLARRDDVLLLDTAAGISPQSLLTLLLAEHVVVVTNPEIAALTDAYALIKCVSSQPVAPAILVIVNRVPRRGFGKATFEKLASVSQRFSGCRIHYLGEIPDDGAVTQRRLGQPPLLVSHPDCEASRCITTILERLEEHVGGYCRRPRSVREGLMQRFKVHLRSRAPR